MLLFAKSAWFITEQKNLNFGGYNMKHITERYGQKCNYLKMKLEDYEKLGTFLLMLGVRSRVFAYYYDGGVQMVEVQAENLYFNLCADSSNYNFCNNLMDEFSIRKRGAFFNA